MRIQKELSIHTQDSVLFPEVWLPRNETLGTRGKVITLCNFISVALKNALTPPPKKCREGFICLKILNYSPLHWGSQGGNLAPSTVEKNKHMDPCLSVCPQISFSSLMCSGPSD